MVAWSAAVRGREQEVGEAVGGSVGEGCFWGMDLQALE